MSTTDLETMSFDEATQVIDFILCSPEFSLAIIDGFELIKAYCQETNTEPNQELATKVLLPWAAKRVGKKFLAESRGVAQLLEQYQDVPAVI